MNSKANRIFAVLLAVCLLFSSATLVFCLRESGREEAAEKYTLYIGLNDKDTYTQEIPTEEARRIVDAICMKYTGGFTCMTARGGWVDESGKETDEISLVYTFSQVEETQLQKIMDEVLEQLNQNSILMERSKVESTWYTGN